tara:strand:- start:151 stop:543 length:393 start_codon:yes stop_codon:yes gene_type:complete
MAIYNDVPHGGKTFMSSGAVPGKEITSETAQTTGTDVPEDKQHLFESGLGENPSKPEMNYNGKTSLNGGLHPDSYVEHDWSRQDRLDMISKLDALNHKLDHILEHFHANTTWTANLGGDNQITFRKDSAC